MPKFFSSLLFDERGRGSSKRVIALLGTLALSLMMVLSAFFTGARPAPDLISAIEMIVITCVGATSLDKFSTRGEQSTPQADQN